MENNSSFKFEATDLEFVEQGIGSNVANHLESRFRPIFQISQGGMGKIFLVQEVLSGRFVALKVMLEKSLRDTSLVHQFIREAVITARLEHLHVIPVHELGFLTEGQLYYTMRYIEGNILDEIIYKVELEERLRILRSAAMAVAYAHEQGLWHRDLKPQNILVGVLGDVYVIDWGLVSVQPNREYKLNLPNIAVERATYVMPDNLLADTNEACTTITRGIMGTPPYMSPEQLAGQDYKMGCASDIWAFGIMLFEAIAEQHPIKNVKSLGVREIMENVIWGELPSPKDILPSAPAILNNLCQKMLAKDVEERMQTLRSLS